MLKGTCYNKKYNVFSFLQLMVSGHSGVILVHARKLVDLACAFGPGTAQSHALSLAEKLVPETENTRNFAKKESAQVRMTKY